MKKKTETQKPEYTVSHCAVTNTTAPANEHTRAAVEALANAARANADAIAACAAALKGGNAILETGIRLGA